MKETSTCKAPEANNEMSTSSAADVWSLSMTFAYLILNEIPQIKGPDSELPCLLPYVSEEFEQIIHGGLSYDPHERLSLE